MNSPRRSVPEWHPEGTVSPQLVSRIEWAAKDVLDVLRRRTGKVRSAPGEFDLAALYRGITNDRTSRTMVKRMLRRAIDVEQGIDVTVAALVLATASGDRPRAEGLLAFLPLCYTLEQLNDAVPRLHRQLEALDPAPRAAVRDLALDAGWDAFAATLRSRIDSMAPERALSPPRQLPALPPRRVVVRLSGGLGNQMFQYAAALAYARRARLPLRLDLANYCGRNQDREFLLGRLRVPVRRANSFEVALARLRPHRQRGAALDPFMFEDHGSAWFTGFWEDSAYFQDILPTLSRRFQPRDAAVSERADSLIERARQNPGPVIGVHLRRGDRAPGGGAFAPFSTLPPTYFREAAARFPPEANFLIFSDTPDDIEWSRANLGLAGAAALTFGEGRDPILDIFALVACDHVILSAGTFSWWAGYLGQRPGRRVIVPNPLQGMSAEWAAIPSREISPAWEQVTLRPGSA